MEVPIGLVVVVLIWFTVMSLPDNCRMDGHLWDNYYLYLGEQRRRCSRCQRVEFYNLEIADIIEEITGVPDRGQWNSVKYSKKGK